MKQLKMFLLASMVIVFNACGGGSSSSDDSSVIPDDGYVIITEDNSKQVLSAVVSSINISDAFEDGPIPVINTTSVKSISIAKSMTIPASKVLSSSSNLKTLAVSGTEQCSEGGSFSYDGTETSGTIIFSDCQESGVIMDGTISFTSNLDGTSMTMTFTNLSIILDENNRLFYASASASISLNAYAEIGNMSIVVTGYSIVNGERTDLDNYKLTLKIDSSSTLMITLDGLIKSDCIGGWVEVKTTEPIQMIGDLCPSIGQLIITGNASSLTVDFNSDGSVDVSGSASDHYNSCEDIDTEVCTN